MESKTESAHFYSRAFRFATHYPVRFLLYPRLSSFVPLGAGFSFPVPRLREGVPKVKAPKRRRGRIKRPASEEMARLAAHQGRESYSHDGVRAAARPFVSFQGGAGGNRNPPAFLFREAGGGHSLFKREYPHWLLPGTPAPCWRKENVGDIPMGKAHLDLQSLMVSPCSPAPQSGAVPSQFLNQFIVNQKEQLSWQSI